MSIVSAQTSFSMATAIEVDPGLLQASSGLFSEEQHLGFSGSFGSFDSESSLNQSNPSQSHYPQVGVQDTPENSFKIPALAICSNPADTTRRQRDIDGEPGLELDEPFSNSTNTSDFDMSNFFDLSRYGSPSSQTLDTMDYELQQIDGQHHDSNGGVRHSPPVCVGTSVPLVRTEPPRSHMAELLQDIETVGKNGMSVCSLGAMVTPLNFMDSHLPDSLNHPLLDWYTIKGSTLSDLLALVYSDYLAQEIEGLLAIAMEAGAKAIRQRQAVRNGLQIDKPSDMTTAKSMLNEVEVASNRRVALGEYSGRVPQTKESSYLLSVTSGGVLRIEYVPEADQNLSSSAQKSAGVLKIFSLPQTRRRTMGVLVTFDHYKRVSLTPRLSPYIQTFNVVPRDSQIIQYILQNDVQGVRRLFEAKLASPMDVDPCGFSLLSVR